MRRIAGCFALGVLGCASAPASGPPHPSATVGAEAAPRPPTPTQMMEAQVAADRQREEDATRAQIAEAQRAETEVRRSVDERVAQEAALVAKMVATCKDARPQREAYAAAVASYKDHQTRAEDWTAKHCRQQAGGKQLTIVTVRGGTRTVEQLPERWDLVCSPASPPADIAGFIMEQEPVCPIPTVVTYCDKLDPL